MPSRGARYTWPTVTAEQLRDDAALGRLVLELVHAGELPRAAASWHLAWGAAEHALAAGRRPGALFRWLLEGRRWSHITETDDGRAAARLRRWRGRCRPAGSTADTDPVRLAQPVGEALLRHHRARAGVPVAQSMTVAAR